MKRILSLFDYSGEWPRPYREAGYQVTQVDIQHGLDVMDLDVAALGPVHGVLAAMPCTCFSGSGAQWWPRHDATGQTAEMLKLLDRTLAIIDELAPAWWALENPVGRIHKLRPQLGKPGLIFQPYEFGDPYRKKTCIWGRFNADLRRTPVEPEGVRAGQPDAWYSKVGGKSQATKNYRSRTPTGFARAFFEANA